MKNKILTLLLSLAISFGLWLYVVTVISPESETTIYNIPVELVGTGYLDSKDLVVISQTDSLRIDLTLSGNRSDLKKLDSSNITVIADLSKITYAGEHQIDCSVSFQSGTAEVLEQTPEYISVTVAEKLTKTVPVEITFVGSVPEGYEADRQDVAMDHTTVTISGPKETIDKIAFAGITVDLSGEMTTFVHNYPLTLCGVDGRPIADDSFVSVNVDDIRAVVQVYKIKRVSLRFEPDYTNSGLQPGMVTIYPVVDTVTLIGSDDALAKAEDVLVFPISLSNYSADATEVFFPALPEGVACKEEIMVHIQIPDMTSRWLTVSQFTKVNVPNGLSVEIVDGVQVEIWGPRDVLEQLTAEDVCGIVDCANVTLGSGFAPVTYIVEGYEYLCVRVDWSNVFIQVQNAEN